MKKIKKFLIIPLVALVFGLLPQRITFAEENLEISPLWENSISITSNNELATHFMSGGLDETTKNFLFEIFSYEEFSNWNDYKNVFLTSNYSSNKYYYYVFLCDDFRYWRNNGEVSGVVNPTGKEYVYTSTDNVIFTLSSTSDLTGNSRLIYRNKTIPIKLSHVTFEDKGIYEDIYYYPDFSPGSDSDRVESMPSVGNGIFITSLEDGQEYNSIKETNGYPVVYKVKGRYTMDFDLFAGDEADKLQIVNSLKSTNELEVLSFKWIKSPSSQAFKGGVVEYEVTLKTYFKDLGKQIVDVTLMMDVDSDSTDFVTREHRYYSDYVYVDLISDSDIPPSYEDGVSDDFNEFPEAPVDGGILEWIQYFGNVIIWLVTYPFRLLGEVFSTLIGYISEMVGILQSTSEQITGLFTFIPDDILKVTYGVISFTLMYSVVRGVLGLIRGGK